MTKKTKKLYTLKQYGTVISILLLGIFFGAVMGIMSERNNQMTEYGQEAYNKGVNNTVKGLWLEDTVGSSLFLPMDLSKIQIPVNAMVVREYDARLHCYYDFMEENIPTNDNTCFTTASIENSFTYSELNKIIPLNSYIYNKGNDIYTCSADGSLYVDNSLEDCLTLLRTEVNKQYNKHIMEKVSDIDTNTYDEVLYERLAYNPYNEYFYGEAR